VNKWTFSVERTSCRKHWKTFFKIALLSILKAYFFLYRNHSILARLLIQRFLTKLHELGVVLVGDQGCVMTAIHIYSSHQSGRMPKSKVRSIIFHLERITPYLYSYSYLSISVISLRIVSK
jgi:hypothetical protein